MSKDFNFKSVTAEQNKDFIRDVFISIKSSHIRQRLLENTTLTLREATDKARVLESAQKHSGSDNSTFGIINAFPKLNSRNIDSSNIPLNGSVNI